MRGAVARSQVAMALLPSFHSLFLLLISVHLLASLHTTSGAGLSSPVVQSISCSTSGNYTPAAAYAANLNKFLTDLPVNAVSKNGGFFNGTVGQGAATVYGLAMCSAQFSRADCSICLTAAASSSGNGGLLQRCPGSTTVLAMFDRCLVRYSDRNFLGTAETDAVYTSYGVDVGAKMAFRDKLAQSLSYLTAQATASPQRFAASLTDPYAVVQCTWDLPPDKCKGCLDGLSANASDLFAVKFQGEQKSYSCSVTYSNTTFMVVPFSAAPGESADQNSTSALPSSNGDGSKTGLMVGSVIGVLVVVVGIFALLWYVLRIRRQQRLREELQLLMEQQEQERRQRDSTIDVRVPRRFSNRELEAATNNFAVDKILGQGGFGIVYQGQLTDTREHVAVKLQKKINGTAMEEYRKEIKIMSGLKHRNIVRLVGWCDNDEQGNYFIVYELITNGTLEDKLYSPGTADADIYGASTQSGSTYLLQDWRIRHNIAVGIAAGLVYLQSECQKCFLHSDIKPSNVVLDGSFNAKLCDFGLLRGFDHAVSTQRTSTVSGTLGYMEPDFADTNGLKRASDVYSFGVVLLEMACGERPVVPKENLHKNSLVDKVRGFYRSGAILDAADKVLRGQNDEQIKRVLMIGLWCVHPHRKARPNIRQVMHYLTDSTASSFPEDLAPDLPSTASGSASGSAASTSQQARGKGKQVVYHTG